MTATTPATTPPVAWRGSGAATQIFVLTARSLRAVALDPRLVVASLLGPLLMLLIFSQIFASVAAAPGFPDVRYIDFLVPAILVTTAVQAGFTTAVGLTQEMSGGIVARLRTLPVRPVSVLVARSLADLARNGLQLLVVMAAAVALFGFRPAAGVAGALAAWALALAVGGCLGWIFIALACWMRSAELMQAVAGVATFPLIFASNAFVPVSALPDWLRLVSLANPVTYGIEAARGLTFGEPAGTAALTAVAISLLVTVTAACAAVHGFRRR